MGKVIQIEVPEEVKILLEEDEVLRKSVESVAKESIKNFLFKFLALDKVLSEKGLTEEEIMEIDEEVKNSLWEKVGKEWNL